MKPKTQANPTTAPQEPRTVLTWGTLTRSGKLIARTFRTREEAREYSRIFPRTGSRIIRVTITEAP